MGSSTSNVKLGVCTVIFDGLDLGYTKGGVEVEVSTNTHEVKVDQFGDTAINELIMGRTVSAKVPLAETTMNNLVSIMPGATLVADGTIATGTITLSTAVPVAGDKVTLAGVQYTFSTTALQAYEILIPAGGFGSIGAAAAALAAVIDNYPSPYDATVSGNVVTVFSKRKGIEWNVVMTRTWATPANCTVTNLTGGTDPTKAKVTVPTGTSLALLSIAKTLTLRPKGTNGADDFTIFRAASAGEMKMSYSLDNERIYNASFKGYALDGQPLFIVGDVTAV